MAKNKKAIEDGQAIKAYKTVDGKKVYKMAPDDVVEIIKRHVRQTMGDWMENNAKIFATRGFFYIKLPYRRPLNAITDDFWRRALREGLHLRRVSVGLAIRTMHGEVLTDI